jgi:hypothetical protein
MSALKQSFSKVEEAVKFQNKAAKPCQYGAACYWFKEGTCHFSHPAQVPSALPFCVFAEGKCPYASCGSCNKIHRKESSNWNMAKREVEYLAKLEHGEIPCRNGITCPHNGKGCMYGHVCRCGEWSCEKCSGSTN